MKKNCFFILAVVLLTLTNLNSYSQDLYEWYNSGTANIGIGAQLQISTTDFFVAGNDGSILTLNKIKSEPNAASVWFKKYPFTTGKVEAKKILKLSDNNFLILGNWYASATVSNTTNSQLFALKVDQNGNVLWTKTYKINNLDKVADAFVSGSSIYIAGNTLKKNQSDILFLKIDNAGAVSLKKTYGTASANEVANCITLAGTSTLIGGSKGTKGLVIRVSNSTGAITFSNDYYGFNGFNIPSFTVTSEAIYALKYVNSTTFYAVGQTKITTSDFGPIYALKLKMTDGVVIPQTATAYYSKMKINDVAFNGSQTIVAGKADHISGYYQGVKLIVFDDNFQLVYSNSSQPLGNVNENQIFIDTKNTSKYFVSALRTINTVSGTTSKTTHLILNDSALGCSFENTIPTPLNAFPLVTKTTLTNSNATVTAANVTRTASFGTYPLTFSCSNPSNSIVAQENEEPQIKSLEITNESKEEAAFVYPTQVTDILNIQTTLENYEISIYDITGKLFYAAKNNTQNNVVNVAELHNGLYFVRITNGTFNKTYKIIKQ